MNSARQFAQQVIDEWPGVLAAAAQMVAEGAPAPLLPAQAAPPGPLEHPRSPQRPLPLPFTIGQEVEYYLRPQSMRVRTNRLPTNPADLTLNLTADVRHEIFKMALDWTNGAFEWTPPKEEEEEKDDDDEEDEEDLTATKGEDLDNDSTTSSTSTTSSMAGRKRRQQTRILASLLLKHIRSTGPWAPKPPKLQKRKRNESKAEPSQQQIRLPIGLIPSLSMTSTQFRQEALMAAHALPNTTDGIGLIQYLAPREFSRPPLLRSVSPGTLLDAPFLGFMIRGPFSGDLRWNKDVEGLPWFGQIAKSLRKHGAKTRYLCVYFEDGAPLALEDLEARPRVKANGKVARATRRDAEVSFFSFLTVPKVWDFSIGGCPMLILLIDPRGGFAH